jgi:5'-nucleotidase
LGGVPKDAVLRAYGAHIFFDDQEVHLAPSALHTPCALVPYKSTSALRKNANVEAAEGAARAKTVGAPQVIALP